MTIQTTTPHRIPAYSPATRPRGACGHRVKGDPVMTDKLHTCPYHEGPAQAACGMRQYLVRTWVFGEPWIMAVEITYHQMRHMERTPMTTGERMVYLGLTAPGTDTDIERAG